MGVIYLIENTQTNKKYIGQTTSSKPITRFKNHLCKARTGKGYNKLHDDIRDIGEEYFSFKVLETTLDMNLTERENYWIKYYNSIEEGYNLIPASGVKYYEERKDKYTEYMYKCMSEVTPQSITNPYTDTRE